MKKKMLGMVIDLMFPFLIGKVLTGIGLETNSETSRAFPFLIGKVLTGEEYEKYK